MKKLLIVMIVVCTVAFPLMAGGEQEGAEAAQAGPTEVRVALPEIVNATFAEGEDMTDNLWTRRFEEEHNVKVVVDWVSAEYETSLNLAIAAGTLPDMFTANPVQFNQLVEARQLQDLKAAYEAHASSGLRKMMEANQSIVETTMFDGEMLAVPRLHYGYETMTSFVWARKDWAQDMGVTALDSIQDFETMMETFQSEYGADFGVMLDQTLRSFFQMSPAWHSYPQLWVEGPDGSIVYGATLPETRDALAQWAEWYEEGFIRPDFATLTTSAMLEDAYNGRAGIYSQQNWAGWQVGADMIRNQGDETYFIPFDLPSVDGGKVMYPIQFPNNVYSVVRDGYEHPEVLVKLVNTYVHVLDEAMVQGTMEIDEVLPFNTNDMHHITGPFKVHFNHYRDVSEVSTAVATGEEIFNSGNAYLFYNEIRKWLDNQDLVGLGRYIQMGEPWSSLVLALDHVDNEHLLFTKMWGAPPQAVRDYGSTLDDLLVEGYAKIITGTEPVSYYDTLIEEWRRAGGDQVTAAVNQMYGDR